MKKRLMGIDGFFFKAKNPIGLRKWYRRHLLLQERI